MKRTFLGVVAIVIVGFIFVLSSSAQGQVVRPAQPLPAVLLPDLVVSKISFTTIPTIADPIMINVEIVNQGKAAAVIPTGKTLWLVTKPNGGAVGPASKGVTIKPRSSFSHSFGLFMAGELKPGIYDIKVTVDPENSMKESSKTNNQWSLGLVVFQKNWRTLYPTLINLATELQRHYSQQEHPQSGRCGDYPSRALSELTSIRERMTAAEAFLNKRPVNSQDARSLVGKFRVHTQNLENLWNEFSDKRPRIQQKYFTAFENFDQKTNQIFNLLSTVLKSQKEMQAGIIRNII
jgi:hypothetical protein